MKPRKIIHDPQGDLFKIELIRIIDLSHPLAKLAQQIDWDRLSEVFSKSYDEIGRPATNTRRLIALHYLKFAFDLSDDETIDAWVENPYWQFFSGNQFFEHSRPFDQSVMSRFRSRIKESGAEELFAETIKTGLKMGAIKPVQLNEVNVDTTVMEKNVRFPTDSRLYNRARESLVKLAKERGIKLRQNYNQIAPQMLIKSQRYAHARQMKRAKSCTKKLRTYLGRVIRDIERKVIELDPKLEQYLSIAKRIYKQKRTDKNKVYSVHEPHVECISKGKAHKRYEFGCKVSIASTSRGGWIVGAKAVHENPYDGHTLKETIAQVERLAKLPEKVFVDMGYRGHDYDGAATVHVDKKTRGKTPKNLWKKMKRRAAIEPTIGHLKSDCRMDRCCLRGELGDKLNALLSAAGLNLRKLLKAVSILCAQNKLTLTTQQIRIISLKIQQITTTKIIWHKFQNSKHCSKLTFA